MNNEKSIDVLNTLVTINNDRIEGYETASEATEEQDLKDLFSRFITTSQECRHELVSEINAMGGEPSESTKTSGKFFRAWMDVKAALTGNDRKAILNSCDRGEEEAQDTYDGVLEDDLQHLNAKQQSMIFSQKSTLKTDQEHIRSLRGALVDA